MRNRVYQWLQYVWYEGGTGYWFLLPLSGIYWLIASLRGLLYRVRVLPIEHLEVPVIVVGNLTVGGTGKTPVAVWLAKEFKQRGFAPGIVSRGYGGSKSSSPMRVDEASDPAVVGDEPVLLARRSACPVAVDRNRVRAAKMLVESGVDLIIADDGLQHLRLARDYEICVLDGRRWLGNRLLLPAGPLRETKRRLDSVDQILVNGELRETGMTTNEQNAISFKLRAPEVCRLNGSLTRAIDRFDGTTVHAVAAIGNPARFFDMLRKHGMEVIEHGYPDHAQIHLDALKFDDELQVLMTEKDAVKFGTRVEDRFWYVPVDINMDAALAGPWIEQMESRMRSEMDRHE